jgi:sarcosine oxidase, subunit delta
MKIMVCPVNGARPVSEFAYAGEFREMPDPASTSDLDWAAYVFNRNGAGGIKREWWCHTPSGVWFIALRDTVSDAVLKTYLFGQGAGRDEGKGGDERGDSA